MSAAVCAAMRAAAASVTLPAVTAAGLLPAGCRALVHAIEAARDALGAHVRGGFGGDRDAALDLAIALAFDTRNAVEALYRGMGAMPALVRPYYDELQRVDAQMRRRRAGVPAGDAPAIGPCFLPAR